MKKYLLSLLAFVCFVNAKGQTRFNFTDSTGTWHVASTYPAATPQNTGFCATTTITYGFKGDTLIGSNIWRKIFYTSDTNFSYTTINLKRAGYLRSVNNVVLYMDTLLQLDTLYNFNFHVGDSAFYNICPQAPYVHVLSIDSIIINGGYHKRFYFSEPTPPCPNVFTYMKEIWIEGIGSVHGPLNPLHPHLTSTEFPDTVNLTCYKHSDTLIWNNIYYADCYTNIVLTVGIKQEVDINNRLSVYPNPTTNSLQVTFSGNIIPATCQMILVTDVLGNELIQQPYSSPSGQAGGVAIDISNLPAGVYFVRLGSSTQKFIKE